MSINKTTLLLLLGFFISGCATTTGIVIEESNYSIKQHRVAITAALGLVREVSQNGRTIYSVYHDKAFRDLEISSKTKERYFTKTSILGSIRPYRVSVEVIHEQRDPETRNWVVVETNESLSRRRAEAIRSLLNQSRDEGGTFDEEAPF